MGKNTGLSLPLWNSHATKQRVQKCICPSRNWGLERLIYFLSQWFRVKTEILTLSSVQNRAYSGPCLLLQTCLLSPSCTLPTPPHGDLWFLQGSIPLSCKVFSLLGTVSFLHLASTPPPEPTAEPLLGTDQNLLDKVFATLMACSWPHGWWLDRGPEHEDKVTKTDPTVASPYLTPPNSPSVK